jgi:hypothetical protein
MTKFKSNIRTHPTIVDEKPVFALLKDIKLENGNIATTNIYYHLLK